MKLLALCTCVLSTWAQPYVHTKNLPQASHPADHSRTRSLAQSDTSDFVLSPGDRPNVTLLIEAVNSSRSDVLNRTLASTRTPTPSGSKENGSGSRKGFTTTTSALAIAALGLFTFAVLTWAKRHQDKRRARGEHVIDGIEQRHDLIRYNESLRQQRIQVIMNQMDTTNAPPMAGPAFANSHGSPNNSRTFAAFSNSNDGEQEVPGRFRVSVPGNMHLNISDSPARFLSETQTASRALFARQSSIPQEPSTVYSQVLSRSLTSRSRSPDPYSSGNPRQSVHKQCSGPRSGFLQIPLETLPDNHLGHLWGPSGAATMTMPMVQDSAELTRTRNRHNATSAPLHFRSLSGPQMEAGMDRGCTSSVSLGSVSSSDP